MKFVYTISDLKLPIQFCSFLSMQKMATFYLSILKPEMVVYWIYQ